jgi:hypothetical protein
MQSITSHTEIQPTFCICGALACEKRILATLCLSVLSSICITTIFDGRIFVKNHLILLKESDDILRFMKQSNKNNGYFTCIPMSIHDPWPRLFFTVFTDCVLCTVRAEVQEAFL